MLSLTLADEEGIYDPSDFNDRLLLGLNSPRSYSTSNYKNGLLTTLNPARGVAIECNDWIISYPLECVRPPIVATD